jgi:hypothetical protein
MALAGLRAFLIGRGHERAASPRCIVSRSGSRHLADGWRRMGNVNRSAIASVHERLAPFGLTVLSDLGPADLERLYSTPARQSPRRVWGALRIAHAGLA